MANCILDHEYAIQAGTLVSPLIDIFQTEVRVDGKAESERKTTFPLTEQSIQSFSGMDRVSENVTDLIATHLRAIDNVKAVLVGKSGDIHHVWTMIREWTPERRKEVYAVQRDLLEKLAGLDLDFYVVALDDGVRPEDMVSGIPVVFDRAA